MSAKCANIQASTGIPDLQGLIRAAADQASAIGAEGYATNRLGVPLQSEKRLPAIGVPQLDGSVGTGANQAPAIRTEGDAADGTRVPAQGEHLLAVADMPQ